jgi:hypothetical protein
MGLFDWLTAKKDAVAIAKYRIWLTREAKSVGIQREVAQALANPAGHCVVIVVAHFNDCVQQLQTAVAGLDQERVFVTCAELLADRTPTDFAADPSTSILIIVGERHPLQSHDDVILEFARSQPDRCLVVYHVSLEDPLLKPFAGEWVERILRQLGMKEDEAIESRLVSRRIQTELEKIARRATGDAPANSVEEWLERNCP